MAKRPDAGGVLGRSLVVLAALTLLVLLARLQSVAAHGRWTLTSGLESVGLNIIARTAHAWPPYHDLDQNASTAIFNFGFYAIEGLAARVLGPDPATLLLGLRVLTLAGVAGAIVYMTRALRTWTAPASGPTASTTLACASFSIALLLGVFVSWWSLTVRPDAWVMSAEVCGLIAAVNALRSTREASVYVAAACFAFAFALKQNALFACAGTTLAFLLHGRVRWAAIVVGAIALCAGLGLLVSGPYYLDHVVGAAARSASYSLQQVRTIVLNDSRPGVFVFGPALLLAPVVMRRKDESLPVVIAFAIALVGGLLQVSRLGSSRNYFFTAYGAAGLLLVLAFVRLRAERDVRRWVLIAASWAASALCIAQLTSDRFGTTELPVNVAELQARLAKIRSAAGPKLVDDPFDALPWNSGELDAETIDSCIYVFAVANGTLSVTVEDRIAQHHYAAAFVKDAAFQAALERAGYRFVESLANGAKHYVRR